MLINFSVKNFRSFGAEQTLNLVAAARLHDHPGHCVPVGNTGKNVLRLGVLYGANAAGKSNLVKAIHTAQQLVLGHTPLKRLSLEQFRFHKKLKPVSLEFRFLVDGQTFVYGFEATPEAVLEEWLDAATETGREVNVFTREEQEIRAGRLKALGKAGEGPQKSLQALKHLGVRKDQLLLNKIIDLPSSRRGELFNRAARWFTECLTALRAGAVYPSLVEFLDAESDFRDFSASCLRNFGTGVTGLHVEQAELDAENVPNLTRREGPDVSFDLDVKEPAKVVRRSLAAHHRVKNVPYSVPFQEESDGTQRCLNLLPALYPLTRACKVFVVDEIDRSLHPLLCRALLKLFTEACPGACQQMIVTTHETHLLDQELLRRDEVWFVEKDELQQSHLTSLVDLKIRNDVRIEKGYLQGRFGGIPFIGDTTKLMDMIQCPAGGSRHAQKTPS